MKSMIDNISNHFKWILEGKLAGSPYPNFKNIQLLENSNIKTIVNLTKHGIPNRVKNQLNSFGITWKRFPIRDFGIPSQATINNYLQCVCESIQKNEAVLTHCIAGCGRTGTMIGLYLITHGHSSMQAIELIHDILGKDCPETKDQIQLLKNYRRNCPNFSQCEGSS
jgi:atypical dual specificity phosphatase